MRTAILAIFIFSLAVSAHGDERAKSSEPKSKRRPIAAIILSCKGSVHVLRPQSKAPRPAQTGMPLYHGDSIESGKTGLVEYVFLRRGKAAPVKRVLLRPNDRQRISLPDAATREASGPKNQDARGSTIIISLRETYRNNPASQSRLRDALIGCCQEYDSSIRHEVLMVLRELAEDGDARSEFYAEVLAPSNYRSPVIRLSSPFDRRDRNLAYASTIRLASNYMILTSEAFNNVEDARKKNIANQIYAAKTYFEMRKLNREYRTVELADYYGRLRKPKTMEDFARYASESPKRLSSNQLDPVTGFINWPHVLLRGEFADVRKDLDRFFAVRAKNQVVVGDDYKDNLKGLDEAMERLKNIVREVDPDEYTTARKFLVSLAYEWRFTVMPAKLPKASPHFVQRFKKVAKLIKDLDSATNAEAKISIIDKLAVYGEHAGNAVPLLTKALHHTNESVRRRAARALGEIGPGANSAVEDLCKCLNDADSQVCAAAVEALGRLRPKASRILPHFIKLVEDDDATVQLVARNGIADIGKESVPFLIKALDRKKDRHWACQVLEGIGREASEAAPALLKATRDGEMHVRIQALMALAAVWPPDDRLTIGDDAVRAIAELLDNETARYAAAHALASIGQRAKPAGASLMRQAFTSDDKLFRVVAARALTKIYPDNSRMATFALETYMKSARDQDRRSLAASVLAMVEIGANASGVIPELVFAIGDEAPEVSAVAINNLVDAGKAAVPALVERLRRIELEPRTQRRILRTLAAIGPSALPALEALTRMLLDRRLDPRTRSEAAIAIGRIGPQGGARAGDALLDAIRSTNDELLRMHCSVAFVRINYRRFTDAKVVFPLLVEAIKHSSPMVKREAAIAFGLLGNYAKRAVPDLEKALKDSDRDVRKAVRLALSQIRG